jgi:hypothetical protein
MDKYFVPAVQLVRQRDVANVAVDSERCYNE